MKQVWKFPVGEWVEFVCPVEIIRAGEQNYTPFVWGEAYLDTPLREPVKRKFRVFGTGHPIPDGSEYVGSFTMVNNGFYLEWHTYEVFE